MPGDFDLVKERIDLVQVMEEHGVRLRKTGRTYVGLCPFHAEKTPSFNVDPDRRSYRCFGCGQTGDVFTFYEKQDGLSRGEALRALAERAGVELTRRAPEEDEHKKRLLAAHETAHFYFRQALRHPAGKVAADYLAGRGIRQETIDKFGMGYAPNIIDGLLLYLRKKGYTDDEAVATGLVIRHERGLFDRFRHRVMIPIRDGRGRIIAFAGRALSPEQRAKYMNSPQTELFDKSATLFALDIAKAAIRRQNEAVIVEGQLDAVSAHQAGFDNVVASMGTALTERQYWIVDDLRVEKATVTFDGDAPGQASAEKRGRELAAVVQRATRVDRAGRGTVAGRRSTGVYVSALPEGTDPDDLARRDPERLRAAIGAAEPVLAFVIEQIRRRSDLASPDGRRRFLAETLPVLAGEPDQLTRQLYLGTLSRLTGVPEESLREQVAARPQDPAPTAPQAPAAPRREWEHVAERYLMAQLIRFPEEAARLDLEPDELQEPDHRAVYALLRSGERPGPRFPAHLAAVVAALGASSPPPVDEGDAARATVLAAMRVREENLRRRMGEVQAALLRGSGDASLLMDELVALGDDLAKLMRTRERDTVLREAAENEDE